MKFNRDSLSILPEKIVRNVSLVLLCLILTFLSVVSLFTTTYFGEDYREIPLYKGDHPLLLLMCTVCCLLLLFFIIKGLKKYSVTSRHIFCITIVYTVLFCTIWILLCQASIEGDPRLVSEAALALSQNDFSDFQYGEYLYRFSHQIGITFFMEILYRIFPNSFYWIFQFINVGALILFLCSIYFSCRLLKVHDTTVIISLFLYMTCFPLLFHVTFVYGNLLSWGLSAFSVFLLFRWLYKKRKAALILSAVTIAVSILLKSNSLIIFIGMLILIIVQSSKEKTLRGLIAILCYLAVIFAVRSLVFNYYSIRTGEAVGENAVPNTAWIAMGMQEGYMAEGWYNDYPLTVYYNNHCDSSLANQEALQSINNSLSQFIKEPGYALHFYCKKLISMWNEPTFECFLISDSTDAQRPWWIESMYHGTMSQVLQYFMNFYHFFILFFSSVCIWIRKRYLTLYQLVPGILFLGGIFFHLLWEAKSQYAINYFILLIPYAAEGCRIVIERLPSLIKKIFSKKETVINEEQ